MSENRELVLYYITYILSQRKCPLSQLGLAEPPIRTDGEEDERATGASPGATSLDEVKAALRDSVSECELRYSRAFGDLHNQLHVTPATVQRTFESVMDELFDSGVNWGRVVMLFAFAGALCVECVDKEMSQLVVQIVGWVADYLDNRIQPWIHSQGGWRRRLQERVKKWLLAGMTLLTGVTLGSLIVQKSLGGGT
ncbi:hypothetical protein Q5P01_017526 [Channa striata]|uniref:Bcl-2 Bcl-2 homology region 1-3 domain-containing protein n=1 Tax=Channa striata TaxID=64152 RepID=A0AA88MD81_CHASR|nr:hypothetical protein Q5P01_017526 [Channa striata]